MHGYEPDEVQPTTELVLSHKHPDDLAHVKALLKQSSAPFSSRHRIRTATGETRKVVVVGAAVTDPSGRTVATRGFYIDITEAFHADLQQEVGDELQVIVAHREVIEQAKGMLMAVYDVSAEAAFSILKWRSQQLNVKLHDVAAKLVADLPSLLQSNLTARTPVDHYLMTLTADDI
jgi:PAS domain S-box-containing protein